MVRLNSFDHVALWASERDRLADVLVECCGLHVIDRTDAFTLVGGDAREGKLTLFAAGDDREPGVIGSVALALPDRQGALDRLGSAGVPVSEEGGRILAAAPSGVRLQLLDGGGFPDLDHVVLTVPRPDETAEGLASLGLERGEGEGEVRVGERRIVLREGDRVGSGSPLLHHLAFLVDDVDRARDDAVERGFPIEREVDAANTRAVFVTGPDGISIEYVEHKPGFSLV